MAVTVLERRGEIRLRRSLGARPSHIATQFITEDAALALIGGIAGLDPAMRAARLSPTLALRAMSRTTLAREGRG